MIKKSKILFLIAGLCMSGILSAQMLKGRLYSLNDSLPVIYWIISTVDSSDQILTATMSDIKGDFLIPVPKGTCYLSITHINYWELQLFNLNQASPDTSDIGAIPMVEPFPYLINVQFVGISARKNKRKQKQHMRSYNKLVKQCDDIIAERGTCKVRLIATTAGNGKSEELRVIYKIDFMELTDKCKP